MHAPETFLEFDWGKVLNMKGNSGPYLQYTCVRAKSVLERGRKRERSKEGKIIEQVNERERVILRQIAQFPGVICDAAKKYSPNLLCGYLYDLCQKYNNYYSGAKILGSEREKEGLFLTEGVAVVVERGLDILGIRVPDRM
jgi:arginyl-tRNA synthetase